MREKLWGGVGIKLEIAEYHLEQMRRSLDRPQPTQLSVAMEAAGTIIDAHWQRSFYARLDAFLSAAQCVPEIVGCCFGKSLGGHRVMIDWFDMLTPDERARREAFSKQFHPHHNALRKLPLSTARNISAHRIGFVDAVKVTIRARFGVTYVGSAVEPVPVAETPMIDGPAPPWFGQTSTAVHPKGDDFSIEGKTPLPLFPECVAYLNCAGNLRRKGRSIASAVHGTKSLTSPPDEIN
jgi:hypothetical protein